MPSFSERSRTSRGKRLKMVSIGIIRSSLTLAWSRSTIWANWRAPSSASVARTSSPRRAASCRACRRRRVFWTISSPTRFIRSSSWPTSIRIVWAADRRASGASWLPAPIALGHDRNDGLIKLVDIGPDDVLDRPQSPEQVLEVGRATAQQDRQDRASRRPPRSPRAKEHCRARVRSRSRPSDPGADGRRTTRRHHRRRP